jgi:hypothetical protein
MSTFTGAATKPDAGTPVADVGCRYGASTPWPGPESAVRRLRHPLTLIEWARRAAEAAGVANRTSSEVISAAACRHAPLAATVKGLIPPAGQSVCAGKRARGSGA